MVIIVKVIDTDAYRSSGGGDGVPVMLDDCDCGGGASVASCFRR